MKRWTRSSMIRIISTALFFLGCHFSLNAQVTFQKTYNVTAEKVEGSNAFKQTSDSGFIIVGNAEGGPVTINFFLLKTDKNGDTLWSKIYDGQGNDRAYSVCETFDKGFLVCGESTSFNPGGGYILKTDSDGNVQWTKNFVNAQTFNWIEQTQDSGFIAVGGNDSVPGDLLFMKCDSVGNVLWTRIMETQNNFWCPMIIQTHDLGFAFISEGNGFQDNLVKLNQSGNLIWSKRITRTTFADPIMFPLSLKETSDHGFIIGTNLWTSSPTTDYIIIKTDSLGQVIWSKSYHSYFDNKIGSVIQDSDGGYLISGMSNDSTNSDHQLYVVKADAIGNSLWSKTYGGSGNEGFGIPGHMYSIRTFDNQIATLLTSTSFGPSTESKIYFVMSDSLGISGCNEFITVTSDSIIPIIDSIETISYLPFNTSATNVTFIATPGINEMNSLCYYDQIYEHIKVNVVSLFPNPAKTEFNIENENSDIHSVKLFDLCGKKIYSSDEVNRRKWTVDCRHFEPGIYFVNVQLDDGIATRKIIVE